MEVLFGVACLALAAGYSAGYSVAGVRAAWLWLLAGLLWLLPRTLLILLFPG